MHRQPDLVEVLPGGDAAAECAARYVAEALTAGVEARSRALWILSGGGTARRLHRTLAREPWKSGVPWSSTHMLWGDERCVPPDHPESNYGAAAEDLVCQLDSAPAVVERIHGELPAEEGARRYEEMLRSRYRRVPRADALVLGLGTDGHTASLFPGTDGEPSRWVIPSRAPRRPHSRVTLTFRVLGSARMAVLLVLGRGKADILGRIARGEELPASRIDAGRLVWVIDEGAASLLPPGFTRPRTAADC